MAKERQEMDRFRSLEGSILQQALPVRSSPGRSAGQPSHRGFARACSDPKPLVLPLVAYGVSYHHEGFKGTVAISPDTLSRLAYEIGMSVARQGITKLVIINGHGGNSPSLHFAAQKINRDARIFTCVDTGETSDPDIYALVDTPNDVHAGEIETSTALAARPALVRREKMKRFVPEFSSRCLNFSSRRSIGWYAYTASISTTGVLGDPTKATKEKGERMWELMIRHLVALIEDLKRLSLDEIHQKRY
ncbi:MAG: creatininase family protein [Desulfobacteraceae bacterium]